MIKAVLWDFGGVLTSSPFEAFNRYEEEHDIPRDFIRGVNATNPDTNAWAQLESSKITLDEFDQAMADETEAAGFRIPGKAVLDLLGGSLRPEMVNALGTIAENYQTACITNNVKGSGEGPGMAQSESKARDVERVMSMFDLVIESSKIGLRKPDPRIYHLACQELSIQPNEAVFLDDLGVNLKPARQLGMQTIKVLNVDQTLADLESVLGMVLR